MNSKGIAPISIILIIILILGVALGVKPIRQKIFKLGERSTIPTISSTPDANTWERFTGQGYTISYPSFLEYSKGTIEQGVPGGEAPIGGTMDFDQWIHPQNNYRIWVSYNKEDVFAGGAFRAENATEENITVAGQETIKRAGIDSISGGTIAMVAPLKNKGYIYSIHFSAENKAQNEDLAIFDKMVSSFKFIK